VEKSAFNGAKVVGPLLLNVNQSPLSSTKREVLYARELQVALLWNTPQTAHICFGGTDVDSHIPIDLRKPSEVNVSKPLAPWDQGLLARGIPINYDASS